MPSHNEKKAPLLSIVVLSYNTKTVTSACLISLLASFGKRLKGSVEILILDNDSTDGSVEMIRTFAKKDRRVKPIFSKKNLGFSKGNNTATKQAKGTYLLFLNSDTTIQKYDIDKLLAEFERYEDIDFLGPKLVNQDGSDQPSCGPFYSLPVIFGALFLKGDTYNLTRFTPTIFQSVDWVSGACLLTKKATFNTLRGFDENIFMYMEEIDLLYRAKQKGFQTCVTPSVSITHIGSASSRKRTFPILQVYQGFLYFYKKHHSRLKLSVLKGMLQLKAQIAIAIGKCFSNEYLISTYGKAKKLVEMA